MVKIVLIFHPSPHTQTALVKCCQQIQFHPHAPNKHLSILVNALQKVADEESCGKNEGFSNLAAIKVEL